ncbi:MAG: hypothetical protein ABGY41_05760, partial [Candidatus Poribacteria bacterium]
ARHNDSTLPVKMARNVKAPGEVSGSVSTKKLAFAYGAYIRYNMVPPAYPSEKAVLGQSIPQIDTCEGEKDECQAGQVVEHDPDVVEPTAAVSMQAMKAYQGRACIFFSPEDVNAVAGGCHHSLVKCSGPGITEPPPAVLHSSCWLPLPSQVESLLQVSWNRPRDPSVRRS